MHSTKNNLFRDQATLRIMGRCCKSSRRRGVKYVLCKRYPGRRPPTCSDSPFGPYGECLGADGFRGPGTASDRPIDPETAERQGDAPVYYLTKNARPGCTYQRDIVLVPSVNRPYARTQIQTFVRKAFQTNYRPIKNICFTVVGPQRVTYTLPDGEPGVWPAWTVRVCWSPCSWCEIPLSGTPQGVPLCTSVRSVDVGRQTDVVNIIDDKFQNFNPFPACVLIGLRAGQSNPDVSPNSQIVDPILQTLWPKDCGAPRCLGTLCDERDGIDKDLDRSVTSEVVEQVLDELDV